MVKFAQQALTCGATLISSAAGRQCYTLRSTDSILWTIRFRNGTVKRFKFPVRTTEEGSAVPGGKFGPDKAEDINMPYLFTEPASLGVELPVLKR